MEITVTLNETEEYMLSALQKDEGARGTLEEYADTFFHNNLWIIYDMYYKEQLAKEKEKEDKNNTVN